MAFSITQWTEENKTGVKTIENKALEKAKKLEVKRLKSGWRYIQIAANTEVLVPCDKKGNPTADGQKKIMQLKNSLGIK